jgi:hypothetical protein
MDHWLTLRSHSAVQFGTEPFTGGKTTFDVSRWSADVN